MKKNSQNQKTKHHILPTSRLNGRPKQGICKVERHRHELYHSLFGNMYPWEILDFLNEEFWNNMYEITIKERRAV